MLYILIHIFVTVPACADPTTGCATNGDPECLRSKVNITEHYKVILCSSVKPTVYTLYFSAGREPGIGIMMYNAGLFLSGLYWYMQLALKLV